jgi:hypothetical protein
MWWAQYDDYAEDIERELAATQKHLRFTTLRVFLHSQVFATDPQGLKKNMERFLNTSATYGMQVGFVFFGDCWIQDGGNVSTPCVPKKGVHNGCWYASPQGSERTTIDRFEPYVTTLIKAFKDDKRVIWWEIFNEPSKKSNFSATLRDAGFKWAQAVSPAAPIIACWDDNPDTEVVDHHQYTANWGSNNAVLNNQKGGVVTEGGSRWYQNNLIGKQSDQGSPKVIFNWLKGRSHCTSCHYTSCPPTPVHTHTCPLGPLASGLKAGVPKKTQYLPGVIMNWATMVGNDNTRWHWGSKEVRRPHRPTLILYPFSQSRPLPPRHAL